MAKKSTSVTDKASTSAKSNLIVAVLVTALIALPAGYLIGNSSDPDDDMAKTDSSHSDTTSDTHDSDSHDSHSHGEPFNVPAATAPQISNLKVTEDAKSGWNVSFDTANFTFAPENASGAHVNGEGHAHIYVDGKKLSRVYSNNYYIDHLDEGERNISVTLNTNDHRDYAVDGAVIEAAQTVVDMHDHSEHEADMDSHSHSDGDSHSHN